MTQPNHEQRRSMIAAAAYLRAERRGFADGDPVTDWLEAEAEVDARLAQDDLIAQHERRLSTAADGLTALKAGLSVLKTGAREKLALDLEKLAKLHEAFRRKVEVLREEGGQAGEKAKNQADKAWNQLSRALRRISSRKPERTQ